MKSNILSQYKAIFNSSITKCKTLTSTLQQGSTVRDMENSLDDMFICWDVFLNKSFEIHNKNIEKLFFFYSKFPKTIIMVISIYIVGSLCINIYMTRNDFIFKSWRKENTLWNYSGRKLYYRNFSMRFEIWCKLHLFAGKSIDEFLNFEHLETSLDLKRAGHSIFEQFVYCERSIIYKIKTNEVFLG